jgi:hypothetical protein
VADDTASKGATILPKSTNPSLAGIARSAVLLAPVEGASRSSSSASRPDRSAAELPAHRIFRRASGPTATNAAQPIAGAFAVTEPVLRQTPGDPVRDTGRTAQLPHLLFRRIAAGNGIGATTDSTAGISRTASSIAPLEAEPLATIIDRAAVPPSAMPIGAPAEPYSAGQPAGRTAATPTNPESAGQAAQVDEIVERAWRMLMTRLSVEQERRGYSRWT